MTWDSVKSPAELPKLGAQADEFEVDVMYGPRLVTLSVHGGLNGATAAGLSGILDAVAQTCSHRVMLDLADVESIDAEGSSAIVNSAASVTAKGPLAIRSASRPCDGSSPFTTFHRA